MTQTLCLNDLHQATVARAGASTHATVDLAADANWQASPQGLLAVTWNAGRLTGARFKTSGDPVADAFLEIYCRTIEGLPCEEAAAYGASYVIHHLAGGQAPSGYQGILGSGGVHPVLAAAEAALRALRPLWRQSPGMPPIERADYLAMPAAWLAVAPEERLAALRRELAAATADGRLPDCGLVVESLEDDIRGRPVRVTLTYPKTADAALLPEQMRRIERLFRQQVAPWLEIYTEERQDRNKLRQTILIDQRPPAAST